MCPPFHIVLLCSAVYCGDAEVDKKVEEEIFRGCYQLVFMSPEAILNDERWRDMLSSEVYRQRLVALVVDEAHCVKTW